VGKVTTSHILIKRPSSALVHDGGLLSHRSAKCSLTATLQLIRSEQLRWTFDIEGRSWARPLAGALRLSHRAYGAAVCGPQHRAHAFPARCCVIPHSCKITFRDKPQNRVDLERKRLSVFGCFEQLFDGHARLIQAPPKSGVSAWAFR
jgi:hypothetical protein